MIAAIVFVVLLILTLFYLRIVQKVTKIAQLVISTLSFAIWVFATGGVLDRLLLNSPSNQAILSLITTIVMIIWTFGIPIFEGVPDLLSRRN